MRTRLSKDARRADILKHARRLFLKRGLAETEMEDIRLSVGISRGGLYHHFANKRAVLDALVADEVSELAEALKAAPASPIAVLLRAGSVHAGGDAGLLPALRTAGDKDDYLSAVSKAHADRLGPDLTRRLDGHVREDVDAGHVAELFLTVNAHINRRELLGHWTSAEAAGFAATALKALVPLMNDASDLTDVIAELGKKASGS